MIGTTIDGRYRIEAVVGAGAFATVCRAVDERLDTPVAVKVLAENHSLDGDVRERFIAEARRLRRVASPHGARRDHARGRQRHRGGPGAEPAGRHRRRRLTLIEPGHQVVARTTTW